MHKATTRHRRANHSDYDVYGDIAKIKSALLNASDGIKGRAGEIWTDSLDGVKEKSVAAQENVTEYIGEKPFKSVAVALFAGLIFGYWFRK